MKGEKRWMNGEGFKHWCYLPIFKQPLFSEMLIEWLAKEKGHKIYIVNYH